MAQLRDAADRQIQWVSGGRFINRNLLRQLPKNTILIGRVRKDNQLYATCQALPGKNGRARRYGYTLPTPEALRTNETIAWHRVSASGAEMRHAFKIKTQGPVLARITGVDTSVRVVVIASLGYRLKTRRKIALPTARLPHLHRPGRAVRRHPAGILLALGNRGKLPECYSQPTARRAVVASPANGEFIPLLFRASHAPKIG